MLTNQVILWGSFIVPWLTLFFMPKDDVKRYMPAGFLITISCIIFTETGITNGWWVIRETTYPLAVIPTYTYGAFPAMAMWSLKFTYGHFRLFLAVEAVLNTGLAYLIYPWIESRGIKDFNDGYFIVFIFASVLSVIAYGYQMWQESIFMRSERIAFSSILHPASAKPSPKDQQDDSDNQ